MWLTTDGEDGAIHVVPINEEGEICLPHFLHTSCPCCPTIEVEDGEVLVIHNQVH